MIEGRITFHARRELWNGAIALHLGVKQEDGSMMVADPITIRTTEPGAVYDPALRITTESAQALMDELWSVGLRPSEGTGSAGALAATQKHLETMEAIACGLLRQQGVEL